MDHYRKSVGDSRWARKADGNMAHVEGFFKKIMRRSGGARGPRLREGVKLRCGKTLGAGVLIEGTDRQRISFRTNRDRGPARKGDRSVNRARWPIFTWKGILAPSPSGQPTWNETSNRSGQS